MALSILGIIAALIPFVIWLWKRRAAKADDPLTKLQNRYEKIDSQIVSPKSPEQTAKMSAAGVDDLDALERMSGPKGCGKQ